MSEGGAGRRAPSSGGLDGAVLDLAVGAGAAHLRFEGDVATWRLVDGRAGADRCEVVAVAPGTHRVDVWLRSVDERAALTALVDMTGGRALLALARLSAEETAPRSRVAHEIAAASIVSRGDVAGVVELPVPTDELTGVRLLSDYGHGLVFEHIYLNARAVAWQCVQGPPRGAAGCDEASFWRWGPQQYLFAFRETVVDGGSVFFLDLAGRRSTGAFIEVDDGRVVHGRLQAQLTVLSKTGYPAGLEPA